MDNNSPPDTNLTGMTPADAKEYIFNFMSTLKLTEKQIQNLEDEITKWQSRIDLANSKCNQELAQEAEKEKSRLLEKQITLKAEAENLKQQIEEIRCQLPLLASRERSIDPDLLEQELLMAAGHLPGDEEKVRTERQFKEMEKMQSADTALEELKAKMRGSVET
ncbi:MAG: chromosome partitioning protein [Treponema sp.]|nr:chromosome partitioning protein [Treponema sp.]MCL2251383.1 chromosome partitioning protein [Treponema sp.]